MAQEMELMLSMFLFLDSLFCLPSAIMQGKILSEEGKKTYIKLLHSPSALKAITECNTLKTVLRGGVSGKHKKISTVDETVLHLVRSLRNELFFAMFCEKT